MSVVNPYVRDYVIAQKSQLTNMLWKKNIIILNICDDSTLSVSTFQNTILPNAKDKNFNAEASKKHISYYGVEVGPNLVAMLAANKDVEEKDEECE